MTSIALPLIKTWWTYVHQMPHPLGSVLPSVAGLNFGKGVSGIESEHRLLFEL